MPPSITLTNSPGDIQVRWGPFSDYVAPKFCQRFGERVLELQLCPSTNSTNAQMAPLASQFYKKPKKSKKHEPVTSSEEEGGQVSSSDSSSESSSESGAETLREQLKATQLALSKSLATIKDLKSSGTTKGGTVINATSSATTSSVSVSLATPKEEKETIDTFRAAGKRFAVLSELWPRPSILKQPYPVGLPSSAPWHPERCENDAAWEVGNVAEVYHIVPKALHVDVEGSAFFSKEFIYGAGKERIYVIDNTRKNASAIFALGSTIPVSYYEREYDRSTVPEFVDLLKNSMKPNDTYAMYPRVLFTDYNSDNREGLFGSRAISNILKVVLLGSSSLATTSTQSRSGPRGRAHEWELKSVTPGSIAMAAIVATFLISPDSKFSERGSVTGINYYDRFKAYKRLIIKTIDTPRITALIAQLNTETLQICAPDPTATTPSTVEQQNSDEEDFFSAFQKKATLRDTSPLPVLSNPVPTSAEHVTHHSGSTPSDDPPAVTTPSDDPPTATTPSDDPPAATTPSDDPPAATTPPDDPPPAINGEPDMTTNPDPASSEDEVVVVKKKSSKAKGAGSKKRGRKATKA